jgi:hypothetical protein
MLIHFKQDWICFLSYPSYTPFQCTLGKLLAWLPLLTPRHTLLFISAEAQTDRSFAFAAVESELIVYSAMHLFHIFNFLN